MSTTSHQPPQVTLTTPEGAGSIYETLDQGRYHLGLALSPEAFAVVKELAHRHGDSTAEVFNKAVGLYKYLSDAVREGKRVGTATQDQELDTELTGL